MLSIALLHDAINAVQIGQLIIILKAHFKSEVTLYCIHVCMSAYFLNSQRVSDRPTTVTQCS